MPCYIDGFMVIIAATFLFGFGLGAFVAWDVISRMPKDTPKHQEWSEVEDE